MNGQLIFFLNFSLGYFIFRYIEEYDWSTCYIPDWDDKCVEHMQKGKAKCYQSQLFPAQHPAIQPVRETPLTNII